MSSLARIAIGALAFTAFPVLAAEDYPHGAPSAASPSSTAKQEKCEHGVTEGRSAPAATRSSLPSTRRRVTVRRARAPRVAVRALSPGAREEGHQVTTARCGGCGSRSPSAITAC